MHKFKVALGDWSGDGHGKCMDQIYECSHSVEDVRGAYRKAVKLSKVALHGQDEKTYRQLSSDYEVLCCEYEDRKVSFEATKRLRSIGVILEDLKLECLYSEDETKKDVIKEDTRVSLMAEEVGRLFMEMAKSQLPGMTYKLVKDEIPYVNGHYSKMNISMGYGCFL